MDIWCSSDKGKRCVITSKSNLSWMSEEEMSDNASCAKMGKKIKLVKKVGLKKALPLSEKTAQRLSSQLAGFLQLDHESSSRIDKSVTDT